MSLTTTEKLNLVGPETARAFIQMQCYLFYYWDEITEMVEQDKTKAELLHCLNAYRARMACHVQECGKWNEKVFELCKEELPGLVHPDIQGMIQAMQILLNGYAGVK